MPVTAATPANLLVGAGDVYVDGAVLGASIDDNAFRIERDYFTPELNGVKGMLRGTTYIDRSEAVLECSIPEISATIMESLWPGSEEAGGTITEDGTRRLPSTAYHDWALQAEGIDGKWFTFEADGGLNLANLEMTLGDSSVAAPRAEVHSTWDAADTDAAPHRIIVADAS
ncbi:MAG TPA: hypothetical protein VI341_13605 [Actinomycetota bacterium]